ncbi:unnamed protein product [Allacma fusca]|uniref:GH18 domain-containing protein n=1 Tax=Allacma fusca TaxID=39272 RepID=A0A8J2L388_9HEXA|nr:unnamed protein product [Allacma fusca]
MQIFLTFSPDPPEESVTINWHYKTLADDGYFNSTVCNKRLVGYFNGKNPNYAFTHVTGLALTHAIYLTLPFQKDGSIDLEQLKSEDNSGSFAEFLLKVKTFDHVISMVSIGENNEDSSRNFSSLASDPVKRIKFIDSVATIIRIFDLRGVDINWQHFYLPEMENNDKENYITLLKELRQVFNEIEKKDEDERKLSISIVGPADASEIDSGLDLPQLLKYADWVNVNLLVEDEKVLPLYPANVSQTNPGRNNADWVLRYYTCKAKEFGPYKINMAVAFQESHSNQSLLSLRERASYTADKNLGGFSVFGIDKFKSRNYTQLEIIRDTNLCKVDINERKFKCYDSGIQRWLPIGKEAPKCGDSAPKVNGFPAVCNPYDPDFGCCGGTGICGSGSGFCNCSSCVDYYNFPEKIV